MKTLVQCSIAIASLLAAGELNAQACDLYASGTVAKVGKQVPVTLVCRGGPALTWSTGYAGSPSRMTAKILKFAPASRPAGAQGLGLQPSQCGLADRPFVPGQFLPEIRMDPASTTIRTGTNVPITISLESYLRDINHFWSFDTKICERPQHAPRSFHASAHRRLDVPIIQQAGRTPGSTIDRVRATTGKTGPGSSQQASQQTSRQTKVDPASQVVLNPQPLPPRTTVLQPRDGTVLATGPMQTTSANQPHVDPQTRIQGTAGGRGTQALGDGMQALLCRGGTVPGIGPYPLKADMQMMYFAPAEEPARADGSALPPERCAFADRTVDEEPHIVLFPATQAEGASVSKSLESADVYWLFLVRQNESGYYEATAHEQLQPENSKSKTAANPFTRLRVTVGPSSVVFTFEGAADQDPRLMVVNGPLKLNADGSTESEGPPLHLKAVRNSSVNQEGKVEFVASSELHGIPQAPNDRLTLVPGAQYHYFLSNFGSSTRQEGDFKTQAMFDPSREDTLEVEQAAPIKSTVLAPATSAPVPATQRLPGR